MVRNKTKMLMAITVCRNFSKFRCLMKVCSLMSMNDESLDLMCCLITHDGSRRIVCPALSVLLRMPQSYNYIYIPSQDFTLVQFNIILCI